MSSTAENIAIVAADYPDYRSGYSDYSYRLGESLQKRFDGEVFIVTTDHPAIGSAQRMLRMRWRIEELGLLLRFLKRHRITTVNIQYPNILYGKRNLVPHLCAAAIRLFGIAVVTTIHEYSNIHPMRRISEAIFFASSQRLIVTSEYERKAIASTYGASIARKLTTINIGSNIRRINTSPRPDSNVIITFGIFYPGRCVDQVIDAMRSIDRRYPGRYVFRFIGAVHDRFDDYYRRCRARAEQELQSAEWIVNRPLDEIGVLFKDAFAGILLYNDGISVRRGSLLALAENGIPIISNKVNDCPELRGIEDNGVFFTDDHGSRVCDHIGTLSGDREFYTGCFTALQAFSERYSFDAIAQEYLKLFSAVRDEEGRKRDRTGTVSLPSGTGDRAGRAPV